MESAEDKILRMSNSMVAVPGGPLSRHMFVVIPEGYEQAHDTYKENDKYLIGGRHNAWHLGTVWSEPIGTNGFESVLIGKDITEYALVIRKKKQKD